MQTQSHAKRQTAPQKPVPCLQNGDKLDAEEFLRRYEAMPELNKAELIEGVVYVMSSPVSKQDHGIPHSAMGWWLMTYRVRTPGVEVADNSTLRLDIANVPQPDVYLRILPECGGQSRSSADNRYVEGAPEMVVEIAASSISYDLHEKLQSFQRQGVREYVVWKVLDNQIDWFSLFRGRYRRLEPDADGISRSRIFPGLWLDSKAMVQQEFLRVTEVLEQGLASPEHATFVEKLQAARRPPKQRRPRNGE